jgi:hypothetical protein
VSSERFLERRIAVAYSKDIHVAVVVVAVRKIREGKRGEATAEREREREREIGSERANEERRTQPCR